MKQTAFSAVRTQAAKSPLAQARGVEVATAWEVLLTQEPHVVGIFPRELRGLSWREVIFESSDGRIALLDDDALVAEFLLKANESS